MKSFALLALTATVFLAGCASSSTRLIAPARPALSPAEVRIYRTPPPHYQEIAFLDASSGARFFHGSPEGEAEAIARLQVEAARVGANGVLITLLGDRAQGSLGVGVGGGGISGGRRGGVAGEGAVSGAAPLVSNAAQGIAIFVTDQR
jgi:hypothetical protein